MAGTRPAADGNNLRQRCTCTDPGCRTPVSSEISDLYEISDLLLFSYFDSQNKEIKSGNYFFGVCCVNENILVRCHVPTTSYSTGKTLSIENFLT